MVILYYAICFVAGINILNGQYVSIIEPKEGGIYHIEGFKKTVFLDIPESLKSNEFRLKNNLLEYSNDEQKWISLTNINTVTEAHSWEPFNLFGSIGVATDKFKFETKLYPGYTDAAFALNKYFLYQVNFVNVGNDDNPYIYKFCINTDDMISNKKDYISEFYVNNGRLRLFLQGCFFINDNIMAIICGCSADDNFMFFYDVKSKTPLGLIAYSNFEYNRINQEITIEKPLTPAMARSQQADNSEFKPPSRKLKIISNNILNSEFYKPKYFSFSLQDAMEKE